MNPPRVRARAGTGEDGKHYFELSLWNFEATEQFGEPWTIGPFDSEKEAKKEMRRATEIAVKALQEAAGAEPNGKHLDLKNGGVLRSFEEN